MSRPYWLRLGNRLGDLANPIMVKEMYQSVHSRMFMAAFWLLTLVSLFTYYAAAAHMDSTGSADIGGEMFAVFAALMALMALVLIPCTAFVGLHREVASGTLELVQITGLGAHRLVRGRLLAAVARTVLLYAVIAPFAVTSFLFGGVDPLWILMVVFGMLLGSLAVCAVAVFMASLTAYRSMRQFAKWLFGILMLAGIVLGIPTLGLMYEELDSISDPGLTALNLAWATVMTALGVMFLNAAAANALSPPAARSSARGKVIAVLMIATLFAWAFTVVMVTAGTDWEEALAVFVIFACPFLAACCLVWLAADRAGRPDAAPGRRPIFVLSTMKRRAGWLLRDGPGTTTVYMLMVLGLIVIGSMVLIMLHLATGSRYTEDLIRIVTYFLVLTPVYTLYISALAGAMAAVLPRRFRKPSARRIAVVIVAAVNVVVLIGVLITLDRYDMEGLNNAACALVPLLYMVSLGAEEPDTAVVIAHMLLPLSLGMAYHIVREARERPRAAMVDRPAEGTP